MCVHLQKVDGTEDARITIRGVGGAENVILRGSGDGSKLFEVMHDYYTIEVRLTFPSSPMAMHLECHNRRNASCFLLILNNTTDCYRHQCLLDFSQHNFGTVGTVRFKPGSGCMLRSNGGG